MNILILSLCFMAVPSVCSAHSGTLVNAFTSYLPFIAPIVAGAVATFKNFFAGFFRASKINNRRRYLLKTQRCIGEE